MNVAAGQSYKVRDAKTSAPIIEQGYISTAMN